MKITMLTYDDLGNPSINLSDGSLLRVKLETPKLARLNGNILAGAGEWGYCSIQPKLAAAARKVQSLCGSDDQLDAVCFVFNWGILCGELASKLRADMASKVE